ncbi:hypothetical protein BH24ACT26_BH24ACT26_06950 [soil metagenome]
MADPGVERLFECLGASFDAAVARQEDEAASDLAFSLLQDRSAFDAFRRAAPLELRLPGGAVAVVSEIGRDYLGAGAPVDLLVPFESAVTASLEVGTPPRVRDRSLLELLHHCARAGLYVELTTSRGVLSGRLKRATGDHVELDGSRRFVIGLHAVETVSLGRGGSVDAP